jgi:Dynein heavy chain C-terminal domain
MRSWPLDKSTLYTVVTKHTSDKELVRLESGTHLFKILLYYDHYYCLLYNVLNRILYLNIYIAVSCVGCYISGLYLEGAAWDDGTGSLRAQDPKVLVVELPIMQVIPIEASKLKLHNTFKTPVYVTQARRNAMGVGLVFEADLTTAGHSSHWVLQGVSLCLNTDS